MRSSSVFCGVEGLCVYHFMFYASISFLHTECLLYVRLKARHRKHGVFSHSLQKCHQERPDHFYLQVSPLRHSEMQPDFFYGPNGVCGQRVQQLRLERLMPFLSIYWDVLLSSEAQWWSKVVRSAEAQSCSTQYVSQLFIIETNTPKK